MESCLKLCVLLSIFSCLYLRVSSDSPSKASTNIPRIGKQNQTKANKESINLLGLSNFFPNRAVKNKWKLVSLKELQLKGSDDSKPERGDFYGYTPFQVFLILAANACHILVLHVYYAIATVVGMTWHEVVYTFDVLRGVPRNRTCESIIAKLLEQPEVVLYFQKNDDEGLESDDDDYEYRGYSGYSQCQNVWRDQQLRAVDPSLTCVRLFQGWNCRGLSLAVYPGSSNESLTSLSGLESVGKCLSSEFEYSTFFKGAGDDPKTMIVRKNGTSTLEIPDLIEFRGSEYLSQDDSNVTNKGAHYVFDQKNRLSWAAITVDINHASSLNNGTEMSSTLKETKEWKRMNKRREDDLGFIIPPELGGSCSDIRNAFPQSRSNYKAWRAVVQSVVSHMEFQRDKIVDLSITLAYENERDTRPSGFYYHALSRHDSFRPIWYDFLKN